MNILVFTQYFFPENFRINSLCLELINRGHKVTVVTGYPNYPSGKIYNGYGITKKYEKIWNGINIIRIPIAPRGKKSVGLLLNCVSFIFSGSWWSLFAKKKYDIVYVFEVSPITVAIPAIVYKCKHNKHLIMNVQDLWPENVEFVLGVKNKVALFILNKLVDYIYRNSDLLLAASNSFVKNICLRGYSTDKVKFWPQFCDEHDLDKSDVCPKEYFKGFNIVFAGNIGEAQGLNVLIDVAMELKQYNDINWYLIGDGRAKEKLVHKVNEKGLNNTVYFIDKMSEYEASRYLKYADCAFMSLKEDKIFEMTIPAKLQTYMSLSKPILASLNGESADIIKKSKCGLVCNAGDSKALSMITLDIYNKSSEELKKIGDNSYNYYLEHYYKKNLIDELEGYMTELI